MAKARFGFWSRVVLGTGLVFCPVRGRADDAPIATAQELNDGGRIEILSLQRTDAGTVTLRFTVTSGRNDLGITLLNLVLIDLDGRRQYSPGLT
ncbi:MAG: hypothetical protein JOZ05_19840, partial [Acetobacteraceae bacterium]|nr:hypothetical protein [Acetobacteraceae bacterium]